MQLFNRRTLIGFGTFCAAVLFSGLSQAVSIGSFSCITNNDAGNCAVGAAELSGDLTGNILTITMSGSDAAVATRIFIEGAGLTGGSFLDGVGIVTFGNAALGGNLPGGNSQGFVSAIHFDAANPGPRNGIGYHNQDQTVVQLGRFRLNGDLSDLRFGVHVTGYANGGSESFITSPIPEPSAAAVFGIGMLIAGRKLRRH